MPLINIDLSRVAAALESIAASLAHFVEADRIEAAAYIEQRTRPRRPVEFGVMDVAASQARYEHERVEDGFDTTLRAARGERLAAAPRRTRPRRRRSSRRPPRSPPPPRRRIAPGPPPL